MRLLRMPHASSLPSAIFWLSAHFLVGGCASETAGEPCASALELDLGLPDHGAVHEVRYTIAGNGIDKISGSIEVSAAESTASVELHGIPPGKGYLFAMWATSLDGTESCQGSSWFDVTVGVATQVDVAMKCKNVSRLGGVRVNGAFNVCAELTRVIVSPLQTADGQVIDVEARAEDAEDDFVRYRWTSTGGDFYYPDEATTRFDCNDAGENETIRIEVSDDEFRYCSDAWAVEISCVDVDLEGSGGSSGTGGPVDGGGGYGGSIGIGFRASPDDECTVSLNLR